MTVKATTRTTSLLSRSCHNSLTSSNSDLSSSTEFNLFYNNPVELLMNSLCVLIMESSNLEILKLNTMHELPNFMIFTQKSPGLTNLKKLKISCNNFYIRNQFIKNNVFQLLKSLPKISNNIEFLDIHYKSNDPKTLEILNAFIRSQKNIHTFKLSVLRDYDKLSSIISSLEESHTNNLVNLKIKLLNNNHINDGGSNNNIYNYKEGNDNKNKLKNYHQIDDQLLSLICKSKKLKTLNFKSEFTNNNNIGNNISSSNISSSSNYYNYYVHDNYKKILSLYENKINSIILGNKDLNFSKLFDDDDNVLNELKNCVKIIETSKPIKALDLI
ncbi:10823_t:CDS:2 [Entrophospora sp. SA101]|nr:10823_t:CDS:2 [Entrophospora sp. SA101]CAJ0918325.1 6591_t:CDS:2 [Entrophospora sp. SA101]